MADFWIRWLNGVGHGYLSLTITADWHRNGLNILPSYTNYFNLDTATLSLQTAALWIGGCLAGLTWGKVTDVIGRRPALFWAAVITIVAIILQTAAQNIAMFVVARILIGFGTSASGLSGPVYLAETFLSTGEDGVWVSSTTVIMLVGWPLTKIPSGGLAKDRKGGLIAAGVTYGTSTINSTWAWRIPSAIQATFSILCLLILPFIPESPRWLTYVNRREDALAVVAQTYANGDTQNPIVLVAFKEIIDTIGYEKNVGESLSLVQMVKTPVARKRVALAASAAVLARSQAKFLVILVKISWKLRANRQRNCVLLSWNDAQ